MSVQNIEAAEPDAVETDSVVLNDDSEDVLNVVPDDASFNEMIERSIGEVPADNEKDESFFSDLKRYAASYKKSLVDNNPVQVVNSEIKWADFARTVQNDPIFKDSSDEDSVQMFESAHKLRCHTGDSKSNDSYSVQLIYCVPRDEGKELCNWTENDEGEECEDAKSKRGCCYESNCISRTANVYLSVLSLKNNIKQIYEIYSKLHVSDGEASDDIMGHYEIINEVSVHPFMDTQGLYVRVEYYNDSDYENGGGSGFYLESQIYTYLFAGDTLQFVKSWEDSSWRLEYDRVDYGDSEKRKIDYDVVQK